MRSCASGSRRTVVVSARTDVPRYVVTPLLPQIHVVGLGQALGHGAREIHPLAVP